MDRRHMEIKKESNRNQTEPQEIKRGRGGARSGAGRPKRGPTLPVSQVEDHTADRAAYDARLAGGESSRKVEPSAITQRVEPETRSMVLDCGTVPQDHDPTGGCCWRRVTGVELIEVKGTVSVRWSPVKVDGTPGPRCQLSLDEWQ